MSDSMVISIPYYAPRPGWRRGPYEVGRVLARLGRRWRLRRGLRGLPWRLGTRVMARYGVRKDSRVVLEEWEHRPLWGP